MTPRFLSVKDMALNVKESALYDFETVRLAFAGRRKNKMPFVFFGLSILSKSLSAAMLYLAVRYIASPHAVIASCVSVAASIMPYGLGKIFDRLAASDARNYSLVENARKTR